jgi:hypothetical protein
MAISIGLKYAVLAAAAISLCACANPSSDVHDKDNTTEIALKDVPSSILALVNDTQPDFVVLEVLKKERGGRVYYDVEGELADGNEIEFDILMNADGPKIVEIQRDIAWSSVPEPARALVDGSNKNNDKVSRVIESIQTDGAIIYEIFVEGKSSAPRFEVWSRESNFKLLSTRWEH